MEVNAAGIPGLQGTDHFGFTVPDLDEASDFLINVIGCDPIYSLGPFASVDDTWMQDHLNTHPRAEMQELRFFRCRNGCNYEVFKYTSPDQRTTQPCNSDIGGHHIAFYVDDLDEAIAYLRAKSIRVLGETTASGGPSAGQRWVYFLAPWGMQFELVSYPAGKQYEAGAPILLWSPRTDDE